MSKDKKIPVKIILVVLVIASLFEFVGRSQSYYDWYLWWQWDRQPIQVQGVVRKIKILKGRDKGCQYLYIKSSSKVPRLDSVLSTKVLRVLKSLDEDILIKYYPTAIGSNYVFYLSEIDGGKIYYSGEFHDEGWQGIAVLILLIGQVGLIGLGIFIIYKL